MRLRGFDYASSGAYFVTVCTARRGLVFGDDVAGQVRLNALGRCVADALSAIPMYHEVEVDRSVVMPDHVHAIVFLGRGAGHETLCAVVGAFKARISRNAGRSPWQRGFHDHIVRDDQDLRIRREYIETNPLRWSLRRP
jgi:REP element-mobilizing transposase RayT